MTRHRPAPTLAWAFFSFRGRLGRQSFALSALFLLLVQLALLLHAASFADESGRVRLEDQTAILFGLAAMASWLLSAWILLAVAIKRLHDINAPAILAVVLLIPAAAFLMFLFLAFMPGSGDTNRHGPPPFGPPGAS